MDSRPSTMLLHISPHLQRRIEEAGFVFGSGSLKVWLVERATLLRDLLAPVEDVDIEEVLRLDREATPATWDLAWPTCVTTGGKLGDVIADGCPDKDAALITHYRIAAPALARALVQARARLAEVGRDCELLRADVERLTPPRLAYDLSVVAPPRPPGNVCNKHDDCEAADREAEAAGKWRAAHCHDEICEDCLGS